MPLTVKKVTVKKTVFLVLVLGICAALGTSLYIGAGYISPSIAHQRFVKATANNNVEKQITHGERALHLYEKQAAPQANRDHFQKLIDLRAQLAHAHLKNNNGPRAEQLVRPLLQRDAITELPPKKRVELESLHATTLFASHQHEEGLEILSSFVEFAGNISHQTISSDQPGNLQTLYVQSLDEARSVINANFDRPPLNFGNDNASQLASATQLVQLGAYYALHPKSFDTAVTLLETAYTLRKTHLPQHARDITAITFILGPLYLHRNQLDKAEQLYLDAFFAQKDILGENSDEFSLYIKMLADVYVKQGHQTQAQSFYNIVKSILKNDVDIFALANRGNDNPNLTIPVSADHPLPQGFEPTDLVRTAAYGIPIINPRENQTGNTAQQDNGQAFSLELSLGLNSNSVDQNDTLPVRLAQLMKLCASDTHDETITISKGFSHDDNDSSFNEHQTGLAVDVNINGRLMRQSDSTWLCFIENGWKFGFVLSYPQNTIRYNENNSIEHSFKPWHWRYIGTHASVLYRELGPLHTLQDFLANLECIGENRNRTQIFINQHCYTNNPSYANNPNQNKKDQALSTPTTQIASNSARLLAEKTALRAFENGPAFVAKGRYKEAQSLYISALKAQEDLHIITDDGNHNKAEAIENPALGFYVGLLADIYDRQGMTLHAKAIRAQMYNIIYKAHHHHQETLSETSPFKITQPVTQLLTLNSTYLPNDLIAAFDYNIPVSKDPTIDEMKLRFGQTSTTHRNALSNNPDNSLPANLAGLLNYCMAQSIDEKISLRSGYRSYNTQFYLFERLRHRGTVTPPGTSEHQTGLAADIDVNGRFMKETDKSYECFVQSAHRYGFILSYPKGNTYLPGENSYEPWHWRYIGPENATLYHQAGPKDQPQEFLAAIECYREQARAKASYFNQDDTDYCFIEDQTFSYSQENLDFFKDKTKTPEPILVNEENNSSARILNRVLRSGQNR